MVVPHQESGQAHKEIKTSAKQHEKVKRRSVGAGVSSHGNGPLEKLEKAAQALVRPMSCPFFLRRYNRLSSLQSPFFPLSHPNFSVSAGDVHGALCRAGHGVGGAPHYRRAPPTVRPHPGTDHHSPHDRPAPQPCHAAEPAVLFPRLPFQAMYDMIQFDVSPRDEVTVLKQQSEEAKALANSPDALPHNTVGGAKVASPGDCFPFLLVPLPYLGTLVCLPPAI